VVANDPEVDEITIVEINPGFLSLIRKYPEVASLLGNPKVHIVIDDGRRWLLGHPDLHFDFILMNTTWHYRAHVSNLLSTEFMGLMRAHLNHGGIAYYNTTYSGDALATGATAFPYALRINSFLAVSNSPITLDKSLWRTALTHYQIDGRPVFDLGKPNQRARLEEVLHLADTLDLPGSQLESRASMLQRMKGARLITDDNMGTEWSATPQH
jgi:SAM-dependent methyltransferase